MRKKGITIIMRKKGAGWFMLPKNWYFKPWELIKMIKLGIYAFGNICLASLPLIISEPLMCALNPELKKRRIIKDYDRDNYKIKDWDKDETKNIMLNLKKAKDQYKATGKIKVSR